MKVNAEPAVVAAEAGAAESRSAELELGCLASAGPDAAAAGIRAEGIPVAVIRAAQITAGEERSPPSRLC
jgi:hypothetical protein